MNKPPPDVIAAAELYEAMAKIDHLPIPDHIQEILSTREEPHDAELAVPSGEVPNRRVRWRHALRRSR